MKIFVTAKPGKKKESIEKTDKTHFTVAVSAPAEKGKANKAIIHVLADYFSIAKSKIRLVSGKTGRHKIFEIPDSIT